MKIKLYRILLIGLCILVSLVIGCKQTQQKDSNQAQNSTNDSKDSNKSDGIKSMMNQSLNSIQDELKKLQPQANQLSEQAQDEMEKLFTFEYFVKTYPAELSDQDLQNELAKLGQERWECFEALIVPNGIKILCNRRPKTYLRYIPKFF